MQHLVKHMLDRIQT